MANFFCLTLASAFALIARRYLKKVRHHLYVLSSQRKVNKCMHQYLMSNLPKSRVRCVLEITGGD